MLIPLRIMAERISEAQFSAQRRGSDIGGTRIFASDAQIKIWTAEAVKARLVIKSVTTIPPPINTLMGVPIITTQVDTPHIGWPANS